VCSSEPPLSLDTMVSYDDREVTAMAQQGQVFPLEPRGVHGVDAAWTPTTPHNVNGDNGKGR